MTKGSRLQSNLIKVGRMKNGQFRLTIPSKVARTMELSSGDVVHFEELYSGGFSIKKVEVIKDGERI